MQNHQLVSKINNLPLHVVLMTSGHIAIVPANIPSVIFDHPEKGIQATIFPDKMIVNGTEIKYNVAYHVSACSDLKEWLKQQDMDAPWL